MRTALLAAVMHNTSGNVKKAADLETYMLNWLETSQSPDDKSLRAVKAWALIDKARRGE